MMHLIWFLLIGAVAGWLAGLLVEGKGKGLIPNMVVGILGAIIGGFLNDHLPHWVSGTLGPFGMAILGAIVLLVLIRLVRNSS